MNASFCNAEYLQFNPFCVDKDKLSLKERLSCGIACLQVKSSTELYKGMEHFFVICS